MKENVLRAVELQKEANTQIDLLGQAEDYVINELMELADSFDQYEQAMFIELMQLS
jgi:hypothetical protein